MYKGMKAQLYPTLDQKEIIDDYLQLFAEVFNLALTKAGEAKEKGKSLSFGQIYHQLMKEKKAEYSQRYPIYSDECLFLASSYALKQFNYSHAKDYHALFFSKDSHKTFFLVPLTAPYEDKGTLALKMNRTKKKAFLPLKGIGIIETRGIPPFSGRYISARITKTQLGRYYLSVQYETKDPSLPIEGDGHPIGIDVGLNEIVVTSDGEKVLNPRFFQVNEARLNRLNRILAHCQKGSANYRKVHLKIAKIYEHLTNQRKDFINKLTLDLVKKHKILVVETFAPVELKADHHLVRSSVEACLGEFFVQLKSKAKWYHRQLIRVDKYYPSTQICSNCGYRNHEAKDLGVRQWVCPNCHQSHDRDINAAKNILAEGLRMLSAPSV